MKTKKTKIEMGQQDEGPHVMTPYKAVAIAEGFWGEEVSEEEYYAAWQYLHDTRLAYSLQGWFGRMATDLIEQGIINA